MMDTLYDALPAIDKVSKCSWIGFVLSEMSDKIILGIWPSNCQKCSSPIDSRRNGWSFELF